MMLFSYPVPFPSFIRTLFFQHINNRKTSGVNSLILTSGFSSRHFALFVSLCIRPPVRPSVLPSDLVFLDACQSKSQTHDDVTVPSPLPFSLFPINSGLKIAFRPRRRLRSSELCPLLAHTRTWSPFAHRELCICPRYVSPGRPHSLSLPLSFFSVTSSLISSLTTSFHLLSLLSFSSQ